MPLETWPNDVLAHISNALLHFIVVSSLWDSMLWRRLGLFASAIWIAVCRQPNISALMYVRRITPCVRVLYCTDSQTDRQSYARVEGSRLPRNRPTKIVLATG